MGIGCVPVHSQCSDCGLQLPTPRDLHPRKVRMRSSCYFQARYGRFDCWSFSLTSVLSINAAISASVVLASRLPDDISVFALMLYAVVLFAMFPVLRHRLQVRSWSRHPFSFGYHKRGKHHIEPIVLSSLCSFRPWMSIYGGVDIERTSLTLVSSMGSIGRTITLPGILYDPSICVIASSRRPIIAIRRMDLRGGSELGPIRRTSRPRMGTEVQKVRNSVITRASC